MSWKTALRYQSTSLPSTRQRPACREHERMPHFMISRGWGSKSLWKRHCHRHGRRERASRCDQFYNPTLTKTINVFFVRPSARVKTERTLSLNPKLFVWGFQRGFRTSPPLGVVICVEIIIYVSHTRREGATF